MGLSNPKDKSPVNGGVSQPLKFDHTLLRVSSGAGLNQVRGINVDGSTGNGIPAHVTNVSCSTSNASVGSTSTVAITFQRDPSDPAFAGVTVWAKGFQGNPTLVQLASGVDSPININMLNTGESVSFQVQAFGNGGMAPLDTAPTVGVRLPPGSSGFGTGTGTATGSPFTSPPSWWNSGDGSNWSWTAGLAPIGNGTANGIKYWMIRITPTIRVSKIVLRVNTGGGGGNVSGYGIYTAVGRNKIFSWDNIDTSVGTTTRTKTLTTPVILAANNYIVACSTNIAGFVSPLSESGYVTSGNPGDSGCPWNINGTPRSGSVTGVMAAGVMPAALGTQVAGGISTAGVPCFTMEA